MLKIEYIWRELLYKAIEEKQPEFSISQLANKFKLSTSLVAHALAPLRGLNIVRIGKLNSQVIDSEKLLFFWATRRNTEKEIIYKTYSSATNYEIESLMPANSVPTAYSACRLLFDINTADYDKIYYYSHSKEEVMERFPPNENKKANIFILQADKFLASYLRIPMGQAFVDLWSLPQWYSREFTEALLLKIKAEIGL